MGSLCMGLLLSCVIPPATTTTLTCPADAPQASIAQPYRIDKSEEVTFKSHKSFELSSSQVVVFAVTFPSMISTKHSENNTVYTEFFCPKIASKAPAVLVLDILDGAGVVSRGEAVWLASRGIPALCVTMPYYGPRRPPEATAGKLRFLNPDLQSSQANIRQGILDARRALVWLADQPEVNPQQLGVVGTSLGSFLGGILTANDPQIKHAALLLGGGGLVDSFADHPQAGVVAAALKAAGITEQALREVVAAVDPLTYAEQLKTKRLLLIGAERDDVVPPSAMKRLWNATGKPPIIWVDATHVGASLYFIRMMQAVEKHIKKAS